MKKTILGMIILLAPFAAGPGNTVILRLNQLYASTNQESVRILMVVGANFGGKERQTLRYAVSDAYMVYEIFSKIGGVHHDNAVISTNPTAETFYSALENYRQKIIAAKKRYARVEALFYYSGHSNEEGIFLGNDRISYKEIREKIDNLPADVRIIILDSCSSGAFTRAKGGKPATPFLQDRAYNMNGYAVITSSSSDENSQESDSIKGSFFTYYLISGLRGAADLSLDRKITLNEIYQFTYNATLSRTEKTWGGAQHPHYSIQMSGTGDVILTDIRESSAHLILSKEITGKLTLRDQKGVLAGEFYKPYGSPMELGLESGRYTITNEDNGRIAEASIALRSGQTLQVSEGSFLVVSKERTVSRGDRSPASLVSGINPQKSYFGGLTLLLSKYNGSTALLTGARGGITFNNVFSIGIEGYGLVTPVPGTGYGGFFIGFNGLPRKTIHFTTSILLGAGSFNPQTGQNVSTAYIPSDQYPSSVFWIAEPQFHIYLNILPNFMIGTGISYRFVLPFLPPSTLIENFNGYSAALIFLYGHF